MTTGQNFYLVDRSGLLNQIKPSDVSTYEATLTTDYEKNDHLKKLVELHDAEIQFSREIPGKAGSIILLTDAENANLAQELLFQAGSIEPKMQRSATVVPFKPAFQNSIELNAVFGGAAQNDNGVSKIRNTLPKAFDLATQAPVYTAPSIAMELAA